MRKFLLVLFFISYWLFLVGPVYGWDDCPFGLINDPAPGSCSRYIDTNNDNICDHSQPDPQGVKDNGVVSTDSSATADELDNLVEEEELITGQELKQKTVSQIASLYQIDVNDYIARLKEESGIKDIKAESLFQSLYDNYGLSPSLAKNIAISLKQDQVGDKINLEEENNNQKDFSKAKMNYNFSLISIILLIFYLISFYLSQTKKISLVFHRQIWNIFLTLSFLLVGLSGIIMVIRLSYRIVIKLPFNLLFWHVEVGIVFALIAVFHLFWHWPYYKNLFKK